MSIAVIDSERIRLEISGAVQGVGFRPFVYRLAREHGLTGWVLNDGAGVLLEVEGRRADLQAFAQRVENESPPNAVVESSRTTWLAAEGLDGFVIKTSDSTASPTVSVLPDIAVCGPCLAEVFDPRNRRYRYPFTNCTDCGPRFSIIEALPYDRPNTTMRRFVMCERCQAEYEDPADRRFHAQPNACPECGPRLELLEPGSRLATGRAALTAAARTVLDGKVLAVKGLGGFHLIVDAGSRKAVEALRLRKGRDEKPLAVMVRTVTDADGLVELSPAARDLLSSGKAPIVLLPRRAGAPVAPGVAPGTPNLGVMVAYTPLHHLLLSEINRPVVATSGNLSDEPIAIRNGEALSRLGAVADTFLVHDRPIARHVDDSVFHLVEERPQPIRRARGWAPLPIGMKRRLPPILALGAHIKNTIALSVGEGVCVSQHIGDLETPQAIDAFERVGQDLLKLYGSRPVAVAHDLHPDFYGTRRLMPGAPRGTGGEGEGEGELWRSLAGTETLGIQHHHAHLAACLADNDTEGTALGVTWDGTGYGTDGTVWGGEFLLGDVGVSQRVASLRPFRLPGGDTAVREPCRVAASLLWSIYGDGVFDRADIAAIRAIASKEHLPLARMLATGFGAPITTSAGRLFDAVSSLLGLRQKIAFEGQAAMSLEFVADTAEHARYDLPLRPARQRSESDAPLWLDWEPMLIAILNDLRAGVDAGRIAARFHNALAAAVVRVAGEVGAVRVALTGGCFQNRLLSARTAAMLGAEGFEVLMHRRLPANDGSISFGQVVAAASRLEGGS